MNDLGMTLVWLALQVSLVLVPALFLYALAARRGPAAGAWVATLSLGLVVALNIAAFLPRMRRGRAVEERRSEESPRRLDAAIDLSAPIRPAAGGWSLSRLRIAWVRLEHQASEPAARFRPWGSGLAVLGLAAAAAGSIQLALGLGAIVACRRHGRSVDDLAMLGLLGDLRTAMGCRKAVELREVADLAGPATAGWLRPVILLPDDWRTWDESERRAVLAHELAHVVRGDYAAGLLARLAVALNYYHPLVHWAAGQLRMQQELAADAIGARHAGGRGGYLVALSRLALRQDGRSPSWPARAFLPARGTLIRRIAMLRDEARTGTDGRPWPRSGRVGAAVFLLGVTAAVATLRGPAWGSEDAVPAAAGAPAARAADAPAPPLFVPANMNGAIVVRPARAYRHAAVRRIVPLLDDVLGMDLSELWTLSAKVMARPGALKLGLEDLEWITAGVRYGHAKNPDGTRPQNVMVGCPAFRTLAPFDWLAFLRQWRLEFAEVREGKAVYYRVKGPLVGALGPNPCVYLPDDRTIVCDGEKEIRKLAMEGPLSPAFVRGSDWLRACRGLAALVLNNEGGAFVKSYDVGDPNDAVFLSLFKGVDHWIVSLDDADAIAVRAAAACRGADASEAIARSIDSLVKQVRRFLDGAAREHPEEARTLEGRMLKGLMDNLRVDHGDRSIDLHVDGFGTLADLATLVEDGVQGEAKEANPRGRDQGRKGPER